MLKIIITYPSPVPNEMTHINSLLAGDIDYLHIRKPDFEQRDLQDYLSQIDPVFHHKIVLHSHFHLIQQFDLAGIHLNRKSLKDLTLSEESDRCYIEPLCLRDGQIEVYRNKPDSVSYSSHSIAEAQALQFKTNYVFLSPIFDSISKPEYKTNFKDLDPIKADLQTTSTKIVALGGITSNHVETIRSLGFSGYAILGDYWQPIINAS